MSERLEACCGEIAHGAAEHEAIGEHTAAEGDKAGIGTTGNRRSAIDDTADNCPMKAH